MTCIVFKGLLSHFLEGITRKYDIPRNV